MKLETTEIDEFRYLVSNTLVWGFSDFTTTALIAYCYLHKSKKESHLPMDFHRFCNHSFVHFYQKDCIRYFKERILH